MIHSASETWGHIEALLVNECGLLPDEGLSKQRPNCIAAIETALAGQREFVRAAIEFLQHPAMSRIRVNGRLMGRRQVAVGLGGEV
jgi:hypothetical protein